MPQQYRIAGMQTYDVIIIGGGAAGLTAAHYSVARGRRTLVLDMGPAPARKVAVSGGGRCNFTNGAAGRNRYFGENPDFVRGTLARVSPTDILDWARGHNIKWGKRPLDNIFAQMAQRTLCAHWWQTWVPGALCNTSLFQMCNLLTNFSV